MLESFHLLLVDVGTFSSFYFSIFGMIINLLFSIFNCSSFIIYFNYTMWSSHPRAPHVLVPTVDSATFRKAQATPCRSSRHSYGRSYGAELPADCHCYSRSSYHQPSRNHRLPCLPP